MTKRVIAACCNKSCKGLLDSNLRVKEEADKKDATDSFQNK
jgi:hypothetical protein